MSYNYLPLDHTPTSFQQIKNLLAYQQLVSITFAGYEAIGKQREIWDKKQASAETNAAELLQAYGEGEGEKVPKELVKLMLALKVKSLSLGRSGVKNETVQRLMDMHNNDVIPIIYTHGLALGQMNLPLIGKGEVTHQNKTHKGEALEELMGWKPLQLKNEEVFALITGNQFIVAYGLYCLIETETLLQKTITIIGSPANYFQAVKDAFDYVLNIFVKALNTDSEKSGMALEHLDYAGYELALPLDFLSVAIAGLVNMYIQTAPPTLPKKYMTESLLNEINLLCSPASIHLLSAESAGVKCLQIIKNAMEIIKN